jgi:hypothetical protein
VPRWIVRARHTLPVAPDGHDDVPRNGPYVLGGMANQGGSAGNLVRELGITKQAASQPIDGKRMEEAQGR